MRLTRPTCATCVFWVLDPTQGGATAGHCHRNPPGIHTNASTGTVIQKFPMTEHRQWCGEWSDDEAGWVDKGHRAVSRAAQKQA